jgi:hypothetical protein
VDEGGRGGEVRHNGLKREGKDLAGLSEFLCMAFSQLHKPLFFLDDIDYITHMDGARSQNCYSFTFG